MEKCKKTYNSILILFVILLSLSCFVSSSVEASTKSDNATKISSVVSGINVRQLGDSQIILTLRGTAIPFPTVLEKKKSAVSLEFKNARVPVEADKQKWWKEMKWDLLYPISVDNPDLSVVYTYDLAREIKVHSAKNSVYFDIMGGNKLKIARISGIQGADCITIVLEKIQKVAPYIPVRIKKTKPAGDPMLKKTITSVNLQDVSLRDVFRIVCAQCGYNLIVDASVPETPSTVSFFQTPFCELFENLLKSHGLGYRFVNNTLVVGTPVALNRTWSENVTREYKVAYAEIEKVPAMLKDLFGLGDKVVVDARRRAVFISATPEEHSQIEEIMNHIDHPGRQVMIQARLIEVNDNAKEQIETLINSVYKGWLATYGVNGLSVERSYVNNNLTPNILNPHSSSSSTGTSSSSKNNAYQLPIPGAREGSVVHIVDDTMKMLDIGLTAMENKNEGKLLASPSVVALDGKKAQIKLTHNYLYQIGVDESRNPQFADKETGPTLTFTPQIGRDGFISMKLDISSGAIVGFRKSGKSEMPETTNRNVETEIRVRNGELFVIGGLYQENHSKTEIRVPIISSLPIIGELFKTKNSADNKSEMAFIVVPYILDIPTGGCEVTYITD